MNDCLWVYVPLGDLAPFRGLEESLINLLISPQSFQKKPSARFLESEESRNASESLTRAILFSFSLCHLSFLHFRLIRRIYTFEYRSSSCSVSFFRRRSRHSSPSRSSRVVCSVAYQLIFSPEACANRRSVFDSSESTTRFVSNRRFGSTTARTPGS